MNGSASSESRGNGPLIIAVLVVFLLVLHQDNWFWSDGRLVFGFLPVGLAWHVGISIAAASTWWLATKIAWPVSPETPADSSAAGTEGDA